MLECLGAGSGWCFGGGLGCSRTDSLSRVVERVVGFFLLVRATCIATPPPPRSRMTSDGARGDPGARPGAPCEKSRYCCCGINVACTSLLRLLCLTHGRPLMPLTLRSTDLHSIRTASLLNTSGDFFSTVWNGSEIAGGPIVRTLLTSSSRPPPYLKVAKPPGFLAFLGAKAQNDILLAGTV